MKLFPQVIVHNCHECPWYYHHKYDDYPSCMANSDDDELYFNRDTVGFEWHEMVEGEEYEIEEPWLTQIHMGCPLNDAPEEVGTVKVSS